ncbi:DNA replication terminus site-binding protein [Vibrio sp. R78045]|uniref:DNA replication terminus site-binding protein n=1 Tax=Vibrio sp. R78045 TaxID=3093868 RepID=UPI0036F2B256
MTESPILTQLQLGHEMAHIAKKIGELRKLVLRGRIIHAEVAILPVPEIDEDGYDTVHSEIEELSPKRLEGLEAVHAYLECLEFNYKKVGLSHKAARRVVGIVHITGSEKLESEIISLIEEINGLKNSFVLELSRTYDTSYLRQQFYTNTYNGVLPKTVTRHIALAPPTVENITFSWLAQGYQLETIDHERALSIAKLRCERKVSNNPDLDLMTLISMDEERLAQHTKSAITWIRPSKLNPRYKCSYPNEEGRVLQEQPRRASVPVLVVKPQPLKRYHSLSDFNGYDRLAKVKGTKRVSRIPIIEEYGMFLHNE